MCIRDSNYTGYDSAAYDAAQQRSSHTPRGPERTALMHKAEATLLHDAPIIPVFVYTYHQLIKPYVTGYQPSALGNYYSKNFDIRPGQDADGGAGGH